MSWKLCTLIQAYERDDSIPFLQVLQVLQVSGRRGVGMLEGNVFLTMTVQIELKIMHAHTISHQSVQFSSVTH